MSTPNLHLDLDLPGEGKAAMTLGERILLAQSPAREVERLGHEELAGLLDELMARAWWNELWERIYALAVAEAVRRYVASVR